MSDPRTEGNTPVGRSPEAISVIPTPENPLTRNVDKAGELNISLKNNDLKSEFSPMFDGKIDLTQKNVGIPSEKSDTAQFDAKLEAARKNITQLGENIEAAKLDGKIEAAQKNIEALGTKIQEAKSEKTGSVDSPISRSIKPETSTVGSNRPEIQDPKSPESIVEKRQKLDSQRAVLAQKLTETSRELAKLKEQYTALKAEEDKDAAKKQDKPEVNPPGDISKNQNQAALLEKPTQPRKPTQATNNSPKPKNVSASVPGVPKVGDRTRTGGKGKLGPLGNTIAAEQIPGENRSRNMSAVAPNFAKNSEKKISIDEALALPQTAATTEEKQKGFAETALGPDVKTKKLDLYSVLDGKMPGGERVAVKAETISIGKNMWAVQDNGSGSASIYGGDYMFSVGKDGEIMSASSSSDGENLKPDVIKKYVKQFNDMGIKCTYTEK